MSDDQRYEPERYGANCGACFLRSKRVGGPVPGEFNPGARFLVVGEAPGETEVEQGRPFVGESGKEAMRALSIVGIRREDASWTNALCCRPSKNDLERLLNDLKGENKRRKATGEAPLPAPADCCRPRLLFELRHFQQVLTLGKRSIGSVAQTEQSILTLRGAPMRGYLTRDGIYRPEPAETRLCPNHACQKEIGSALSFCPSCGSSFPALTPPPDAHHLQILPAFHPSFVLRQQRWRQTFQTDIGRAVRFFRGELKWSDPKVILNPIPAELKAWLDARGGFVACDVETLPGMPDGVSYDALVDRLGCIGFATENEAICVSILDKDGVSQHYSDEDLGQIKGILRDFFLSGRVLVVGHNFGYYDTMVLENNLGYRPARILDTILMHRAVDPELPHNLGFVGSTYTDVHAWKADNTAKTAKTNHEWMLYNCIDNVVTARIVKPLDNGVGLRMQANAVKIHHTIQESCVGMHKNGLLIDQKKRTVHDARELATAKHHLRIIRDIVGVNFNPSSHEQVRDLIYERWGLESTVLNYIDKRKLYSKKTGLPSTSDEVIRALMREERLSSSQKAFLDSQRRFRRATKARGTYLVRFRPPQQYAEDELMVNTEVEDAETRGDLDPGEAKRIRREMKKGSLIWPDGRIRPTWSAHPVVTGRLSSSDPNGQNLPDFLRDMIIPSPGHLFVDADMDQVELRIAAMKARARAYLRVFADRDADAHTITALAVFGETGRLIREASIAKYGSAKAANKAKDSEWKQLRDFAKCITGDTRVLVAGRGFVRVKDLQPRAMSPGEDAAIDVDIVGAHGEVKKATRFYYGGKQQIFRLRTQSGFEIRGTGEHRLLLANGEWRRLDEVRPGEELRLGDCKKADARLPQRVAINPWLVKAGPGARSVRDGSDPVVHAALSMPTFVFDTEWSYLLGAIMGEGCVSDAFVSVVGLPADGVARRVFEICEHVGLAPRYSERHGRKEGHQTLAQVVIPSIQFIDLLSRLGMARRREPKKESATGKRARQQPRKILRVPDVVFRSPKEITVAFLAGLFDTDGTFSKQSGWALGSKSRELLHDVKLLLSALGIESSIYESWNRQYARFYFALRISRRATREFGRHVAALMHCRRKVEAARIHSRGWTGRARPVLDAVAGIESAGEEDVYDLHVPEGHDFVANGLVNHNTFTYAVLYKATEETVHGIMVSTEDREGNLPYANLTLREVRDRRRRWLDTNPEIEQWWATELRRWRQLRYVDEPVYGYRVDVLDGESEENKIINNGVQMWGAHMVHKSTKILIEGEIPFQKWGPGTGLVQQGHDALLFEVPAEEAERLKHAVTEAMTQQVEGYPEITFTAEAKIAPYWS